MILRPPGFQNVHRNECGHLAEQAVLCAAKFEEIFIYTVQPLADDMPAAVQNSVLLAVQADMASLEWTAAASVTLIAVVATVVSVCVSRHQVSLLTQQIIQLHSKSVHGKFAMCCMTSLPVIPAC